jgi:thioredoxin reductase (NADPH)
LYEALIIGGGPAGLTAGMYCRMREMTCLILDAGRAGGQLISLYGDKPVHDWPGYHHIIANELAGHLIRHADELKVETIGNHKVLDLTKHAEEHFEAHARNVVTGEEKHVEAKSVVVAIGGGAFEPRKLRVAGEDQLTEDVLTYRMPDKSKVAGRKVVVVGGGDSGLESAQSAHEAGAAVTMVQVLERFTGMESNINAVGRMGIPVLFNTRVTGLSSENGSLKGVNVTTKGQGPSQLDCDYLVVNIGAAVNLDAVKRWGIDIEGNQIKVDGEMKTSVGGIFACGDIVTYPGKYKLLITAASEGAVAANSAYIHVRKPPRLTMTDLYT